MLYDNVRLNIRDGPIIGRRLSFNGSQALAFQGIPFAKPPIGPLRFKKPEPIDSWLEPKECKSFMNQSIQKISENKPDMPPISEDCLYLNVFTPAFESEEQEGFPVFFFVHGGGYAVESTAKYKERGICEELVRKGVVVVTVEYRLGMLGFFTTGDECCPGNNALWDLKLALEWTRDNIGFFSGNKNNITVSGQSAGSALTQLLAISPHTRDLFHKMIGMAGFTNYYCNWFNTRHGIENCRKFAKKLGVEHSDSQQLLDQLRRVPAEKFALGIEMNIETQELLIAPRYDGDFFPLPFEDLTASAPAKPAIFGCAHSEAFISPNAVFNHDELQKSIAQAIPESIFQLSTLSKRHALKQLLTNQHHTWPDKIMQMIVEVESGIFMGFGLQKAIFDWLSKSPQIYMYSFEHSNPIVCESMGMPFDAAIHCAELTYLFQIHTFTPFEFDAVDNIVMRITTEKFMNFCKYGNPNGPSSSGNSVEWLPCSHTSPQRHLVISENSHMKDVYKGGFPLYVVEETQLARSI